MNCYNGEEPYSFHTGGMNLVLADGSARFVSQEIDILIMRYLISRAGSEVLP
ncbi:MAG: DUF1559 domain-containing protein, partial [Rhodobacteraceae bacterium]|nr:DUF1559 domain-containing protein [Paracoccaceae bacterium]